MADQDPNDLIRQLIAQGPTAGNTKTPIGVPSDYTAEVANPDQYGPGAPLRIPPRYFQGHEFVPAGLAPEKIAAIQRGLLEAGLIGRSQKFRLGLWDETTRNAYKELLSFANQQGVDDQEALRQYASIAEFPEQGGAARQPLTKKLTNPADLRATFETAAIADMGRKPDPGFVDTMVAAYQAAEAAVQEEAYAMDETGGTVTAPPDPSVFAHERIRQQYAAETEAHEFAGQFGTFEQMLGGPGG